MPLDRSQINIDLLGQLVYSPSALFTQSVDSLPQGVGLTGYRLRSLRNGRDGRRIYEILVGRMGERTDLYLGRLGIPANGFTGECGTLDPVVSNSIRGKLFRSVYISLVPDAHPNFELLVINFSDQEIRQTIFPASAECFVPPCCDGFEMLAP